ncbi:MAG: ABC transporter permease subunit [Nocardioidaceae bacterium]
MPDVMAVTRAELFKLVRRPAMWALLAAAVVLQEIFSYLIPYISYVSGGGPAKGVKPPQYLVSTLPAQLVDNTISGFPVFIGALAVVFGALMFGGEYGWNTVKTQLTQRPTRLVVLAGQLVALAASVLVSVVVLLAVGAVTSTAIAAGQGRAMNWPWFGVIVAGVGAGWLVLMTWAALGAVMGVAMRGVALPIGLGVVWVLGIENLIAAMADSVLTGLQPLRDVLPGSSSGSLVFAAMPPRTLPPPPGVASSVSGTQALATLVGYVAVAMVITAWMTRRRDVV